MGNDVGGVPFHLPTEIKRSPPQMRQGLKGRRKKSCSNARGLGTKTRKECAEVAKVGSSRSASAPSCEAEDGGSQDRNGKGVTKPRATEQNQKPGEWIRLTMITAINVSVSEENPEDKMKEGASRKSKSNSKSEGPN